MSVIVAIKENGVVYMGADSQTSAGKTKEHRLNETGFKVTRLENGMLVGFCGRVAVRQAILSIASEVFTLNESGKLDKAHIVKEIIPKFAKYLNSEGDEENGTLGVSVLLAHKDELYQITPDLDVLHLNEYSASGAGKMYAFYALSQRLDLPVRERLLSALVESAKRTPSVSGPFVLIDSKNLEYEIVDMGGENY